MRIIFIGTGEISVPTLDALQESPRHEVVGLVTQPDRRAGRSQALTPPPVKAAVVNSGLPMLQPEKINAPEAIAWLGQLDPDVLVVMAYGQILPPAVLEIPKVACLNLHASLLPRHRGASCIQAAIAAGDGETGVTVMHMDKGLDTGDIVLQRSVPIVPDESGGSLHDKLALVAPSLLLEALDLLASGKAPRNPQDNSLATYAPKLERDQGRITWGESAEAVERTIRAYDPWPGAFTTVHAEGRTPAKLKIFRASVSDQSSETGVLTIRNGNLFIGRIQLQEVQLEGKKRMSVAELLRGNAWMADARIA